MLHVNINNNKNKNNRCHHCHHHNHFIVSHGKLANRKWVYSTKWGTHKILNRFDPIKPVFNVNCLNVFVERGKLVIYRCNKLITPSCYCVEKKQKSGGGRVLQVISNSRTFGRSFDVSQMFFFSGIKGSASFSNITPRTIIVQGILYTTFHRRSEFRSWELLL